MAQNFETRLVRLRPRAAIMLLPTLVLAGSSFSVMYFSELVSPEVYQIVLWAALAASLVFWLLPLLNWLAASLVVTDQRVIHRSGVF